MFFRYATRVGARRYHVVLFYAPLLRGAAYFERYNNNGV